MATRKQAADFDQRVLNLYDDYAHGRVSRRDFAQRAAAFLTAGVTVDALLASLTPNYAWAEQVAKDDPRIHTELTRTSPPKAAGRSAVSSPTPPRTARNSPPSW